MVPHPWPILAESEELILYPRKWRRILSFHLRRRRNRPMPCELLVAAVQQPEINTEGHTLSHQHGMAMFCGTAESGGPMSRVGHKAT